VRDETEAERTDRNLNELLQELRVAGLGVQVLFGFLLSLPFTNRFVELNSSQRDLYLADLLLTALAAALLLAPVAYHRLLFRHHEKVRLVRVANIAAVLGLTAGGLAISSAVLLDVSFVESGAIVPAIGVATFAAFAFIWFAFPMWRRFRERAH
jgi:O-antigen/teichoic acid export membrane protein